MLRWKGINSHGPQESHGLPTGVAEPLRPLRTRRYRPPRIPGWREEVRGWRLDGYGDLGEPSPQLRLGATGTQRRQPNQDRIRDGSFAPGQWKHKGVPGSSRERQWKVARSAGGAREPRLESLYRGRGAAFRYGELHGLRAGWS